MSSVLIVDDNAVALRAQRRGCQRDAPCGMTVERVSSLEMLLRHVPHECVLMIRFVVLEAVKGNVVDELGWTEEPSHVVTIGISSVMTHA